MKIRGYFIFFIMVDVGNYMKVSSYFTFLYIIEEESNLDTYLWITLVYFENFFIFLQCPPRMLDGFM